MTSSSRSRFKDLGKRLVTGFLGAFFLIFMMVYHQYTFFFVILGIGVLTQIEFYDLVRKSGREPSSSYGLVMGILLFLIVALVELDLATYDLIYLYIPLVSIIYILELYKIHGHPFTNIAYSIMGVVYVMLPLSMLTMIAFIEGDYNYVVVVGLFFLIWSNDVGAYFAGILFGKSKLFERISPKKTWEGAVGGAAFSQFFAFLLFKFFGYQQPLHWHFIALIVVAAGNYGDLVESLFKRSVAIKDSSSKLPGHGGFLDRFDSLIMAIPFVLAYLKLVSYFNL